MRQIKRLTIAVFAILLMACSKKETEEKPNIIIFLVDDMGLMDTSVPMLTDESGNPKRYPLNDWYRTPNMERLAERGVRFSNFYAQALCTPTRVSIMTGQNSARHQVTAVVKPDNSNNGGPNMPSEWKWKGMTPKDVTLPSILSQNGFKTIHIGKAHFATTASEASDPRNIGFDVNIAGSAIGHPKSYYGKK